MFKLLDRVQDGVVPMLHHLQHFIKEAGLSDMHACASTITVVSLYIVNIQYIDYSINV